MAKKEKSDYERTLDSMNALREMAEESTRAVLLEQTDSTWTQNLLQKLQEMEEETEDEEDLDEDIDISSIVAESDDEDMDDVVSELSPETYKKAADAALLRGQIKRADNFTRASNSEIYKSYIGKDIELNGSVYTIKDIAFNGRVINVNMDAKKFIQIGKNEIRILSRSGDDMIMASKVGGNPIYLSRKVANIFMKIAKSGGFDYTIDNFRIEGIHENYDMDDVVSELSPETYKKAADAATLRGQTKRADNFTRASKPEIYNKYIGKSIKVNDTDFVVKDITYVGNIININLGGSYYIAIDEKDIVLKSTNRSMVIPLASKAGKMPIYISRSVANMFMNIAKSGGFDYTIDNFRIEGIHENYDMDDDDMYEADDMEHDEPDGDEVPGLSDGDEDDKEDDEERLLSQITEKELEDLIANVVQKVLGGGQLDDEAPVSDETDLTTGEEIPAEDEDEEEDEEDQEDEEEEDEDEKKMDEDLKNLLENLRKQENKIKGKPSLQTQLNEVKKENALLKKTLNEMHLHNSKLVYCSKLFAMQNLTESMKIKIAKRLDSAKNAGEAKAIYETLADAIGNNKNAKTKSVINESIGGASKSTPKIDAKQQTNTMTSDRFSPERMKFLAGLK